MNIDYSNLSDEQYIELTIQELNAIKSSLVLNSYTSFSKISNIDKINNIRRTLPKRNIKIDNISYIDHNDDTNEIINKVSLMIRELDSILMTN